MTDAISNDTNRRDDEVGSPFLVFKLSWVAYLSEAWRFLLRFAIFGMIAFAAMKLLAIGTKKPEQEWLLVLSFFLAIAYTVYSIAMTRSVVICTDETGVWRYAGIFPWQKGITGVKWRDLGEAGYTTGLMPWMMRSYSIVVSHRFSQGAELAVKHVYRGNLAVEHINQLMMSVSARMERP